MPGIGTREEKSGLGRRWLDLHCWGMTSCASTTGANPSNYLYLAPLWVACSMRVNTIGVLVVETSSSALTRLGIYRGHPPKELVVDAGTVGADTVGYKEIALGLGLPRGWYYLAWWTNANLQGYRSDQGMPCPGGLIAVAENDGGAIRVRAVTGYRVEGNYSGGLPQWLTGDYAPSPAYVELIYAFVRGI